MKKAYLIITLFITLIGYSQNGISYQALILNPNGEELPGVNNTNAPLSNKLICLKFSILDSNSNLEYIETHKITTDAFGIVNLIIGTGNQIGGYASSFSNILWNNTAKNLKVDLDVHANCTYFIEISNQPFTYVPFAYYAANAHVDEATTISTGIVQLAGDLGGTGTTASAPIISNNAITSAKILNGAVTPIKIASGGNNTVLVTDATGNVAWINSNSFGAVADMATIEGAGTSANPFKVKDLGIVTNKIADNAVTTQKLANGAVTNAKIGEVISVPNGGTGASSLTGYVKGNGTAAMTAATSIPVADVVGAQTIANLITNIASNSGSTTLYPSVSAVETFVANSATPDATTTVKGKIKLAGDLSGTADLPTVPGLTLKAPLASPALTGTPTAPTATAGDSSTQIATTAFVGSSISSAVSAATTPDATTTVKGKIKLAGDLSGTADLPTVPALANKENTIAVGTNSQYWRGDKTWQTLDKSAVGLDNVNNTADVDKPISTAVQTALNGKEDVANKSNVTTLGTSDLLYPTQNAVKIYVDSQLAAGVVDATSSVKGKLKLAGDLGGTADTPTVPALANKENTIVAGTTSQYWRGDKTWQTLDKSAVGLGNVDNTADADKPISTAVQAALNTKENTANKSNVTTLGTSDVLFPTQNAVKTYVDNQIVANATPDATTTVKGKLQLAGDLAGTGSSAANPVISNNAITTSKILDAAVTPVKIAAGSNDSVLVTDNTGTVVWIDKGALGAVADLSTIEGVGTTVNPFKVKDLGIITAKLVNGAVTTAKLADDAVTNAKIGEIISVENGGTGSNMTTTAGYVKQATTGANLSTVSTIPVTDVTGAVRSVNGVVPASDGNVAVIIGRVFTGSPVNPDLATSIINASPAKQSSDIYIVASTGNPNNGRTFIYDGTNWLEVATDLSTTDARYVNVDGDTMEGNLTVPTGTKIILADAPTGSTDAVNKAYVDGLITSSATPDATASVKGKIKLAGDLGGTADTPTVPDLALKAPLESPSLTGTPLAPTAAAGTNTTQIATTAFVTAATAGLQDAITLTTTGTGAASLVGSTLNIPTPNNGTVTEVSALTIGTSGTDITSTVATATTTPVVTLNVPTASAANRGALSAADWTTFNNKVGGSGTTNFVPKFSGSSTITDSKIFDNGTNVGIGTTSPTASLHVNSSTVASNTVNADVTMFRLARPVNSGVKFPNIANFNLGSYTSGGQSNTRLDLNLSNINDTDIPNVMTWQANGYVGIGTTAPISSFSNTSTAIQGSNSTNAYNGGLTWSTPGTGFAASFYSQPTIGNGLQIKIAGNTSSNNALEVSSGATSTGSLTPLFNVLGNGNIGVGTSTPSGAFEVATTNGLSALIRRGGTSFQTPANLILQKTSGANAATHGAVVNGDFVGRILFSASNGSSYLTNGTDIVGYAAGTQSATNNGGGIFFRTVPQNSVLQSVERMRIDENGNIGIGTNGPTAQLHTTGSVRLAGAGAPGTGKVLTSDASGNATWQPVNFATAVSNKTADFTLTASDSGSVIVVNSATTVTVTVPSTFSAGFYCQIIQSGAGQVNVVGSGGITITSALGNYSRTTGSSIGIMIINSTNAFLSGDTAF